MAVELLSVSRAAVQKKTSEEAAAPAEAPQPSYEPASEYAQPASDYAEPTARAVEQPSYSEPETIPYYESAPAEPSSFVEAVPVDDGTSAFEASHPETQTPEVMGEEPAWSPPMDASAAAPPRRRYGQDTELPVEVSGDEERRLHNDARRFARLLISEIKLYNEQKVAEGRSEHDLYDRLREYIDRSREMYDKRVKAEVASRYDYFHGELVNTLAEGDASKLGSNYPGATVNA
jgi:hypothetical protein